MYPEALVLGVVLERKERRWSIHKNKGQSTPLPSVIEYPQVSAVWAGGVCRVPWFAIYVLTPKVLPISFFLEGEIKLNSEARNEKREM